MSSASLSCEALVREAGEQIHLCPKKLNGILDRLEEEYISQSWQLESVSNEQWKTMGAPIGFVISLRSCIASRRTNSNVNNNVNTEKRRSCRRHSLQHDLLSSSPSTMSSPHKPKEEHKQQQRRRRVSKSVQPNPDRRRDSRESYSSPSSCSSTSLKEKLEGDKTTRRDSPHLTHRIKRSTSKSQQRQEQDEQHREDAPPPVSPSLAVVERNPETGRLCYMAHDGRVLYEWEETFDTVVLFIPKPDDGPADGNHEPMDVMNDVICRIGKRTLLIGSKKDRTVFFRRPTGGKVLPEKSTWVPYGGMQVKGMIVTLHKAHPGVKWKRPLLTPAPKSSTTSPSSSSTTASSPTSSNSSSLGDYLETYHTDGESVAPLLPKNIKKKKKTATRASDTTKKGSSVESSTQCSSPQPQRQRTTMPTSTEEEGSVDHQSRNHSLASQETQPVQNGTSTAATGGGGCSSSLSSTINNDDAASGHNDDDTTTNNDDAGYDDDDESLLTIQNLTATPKDDSSFASRWSRRARKGANRKFWSPPQTTMMNKKNSFRLKKKKGYNVRKEPPYSANCRGTQGEEDAGNKVVDSSSARMMLPEVPFKEFVSDESDEGDEEIHSILTETTQPSSSCCSEEDGPIITFPFPRHYHQESSVPPPPFGSERSMSTISTMGSRSTIQTLLSNRMLEKPHEQQQQQQRAGENEEVTYDLARRSSRSMKEFNRMVHHYSRPQKEVNNSLRSFARSINSNNDSSLLLQQEEGSTRE
eukprot:scaffold2428_cov97-Cylindrotheca_fusiformis.AAC.3